jgi:two-component system, chemotaxis family, CheB/CheR fusion protein
MESRARPQRRRKPVAGPSLRSARRTKNAVAARASSPHPQAERMRGPTTAPAPSASAFPIVAIGASAGGVEAFKRFFERMPPDSGMAFVLIPHLDPTQKSLMVELLGKQTRMPVVEAEQGMLIRPNHVYVIPPNRYLAIKRRRLVLSKLPEAPAGQTAIDFALRSLAEDQHENAIGIVLSGTGSHGTAGLKEIKLAGGLVLVQDPTTAQHEQMPRSALEAGIPVDFVLAPERMPEALVSYIQHARGSAATAQTTDSSALDGLGVILALLREQTKSDFRFYRKNMIFRRIQRRMALLEIPALAGYIDRLRQDSDEVAALRRDLLISVTAFFREPEAFNVLAKEVLPDLVRHASADAPLRVWIPACATGEEAYSIAILLVEQFRAVRKAVHLQIFASDVDQESLSIARRGIYPDSVAHAVSSERLQRFFTRTEPHQYQIAKQLREVINFAHQNLVSDPPFSRCDLVSCRNALIYLEPDVQAKVIELLHFALKPGGYLMLGPAESIGSATDLFEPVSKKWRVYRSAKSARRRLVSLPTVRTAGVTFAETLEPPRRTGVGDTELMQRLLLAEFAPAAILVNRKYQILAVQGPVVNYLRLPPGALTHDLLAMARESLRGAIRAACEKALRKGAMVRNVSARVRRNGHYVTCRISARPIIRREAKEELLLIVFEDALAPAPRGRQRHGTRGVRATHELEEELRATQEDLQRTITELENSNADLQGSNEEVMSANEELQSTNEELESSREELKSMNEELTTVNNQLEEKVHELDAANSDLNNLTAATDIAIVFLDVELRIRRFTPPAGRLLNLMPEDLGRPLQHLAPLLSDDSLLADARRVMKTRTPIEKEIRSSDDRWYLRRILPYATDDVAGTVVTFIDITQRLQAEAQAHRLAAVLRDSSDAIAVMDLDGRITAWNHGAEVLYGYSETQALKMTLTELATVESRDQNLDVIKRAALGEAVAAFETQRRASDGRVLDVWATVTLVRDASGKPSLLAMTERDITARKRAEEEIRGLNAQLEQRVAKRTRELQASEYQMTCILEASSEAIVTIDSSGKIVTFNRAAARAFGYDAEEVVGRNVRLLMPPSERERHEAYLGRYLKTHEPHIIGRTRALSASRKDGSLFPIELTVSEVDGLKLFVGCIRDVTASRALQEEILNIAMLEQRRIGVELHDGTQQELTGLGLLAQNLKEKLSQQGVKADAELADRIASGIAHANLHVRDLAHGLIPIPIDADSLPAALAELAQSTEESYALKCRLECPAPVKVADADTATHLYRIAQEAVGNVVKHAKADAVWIRLAHANEELKLEVADNGVGIDLKEGPRDGVGLRLMEYRCSVIGGRFSIQKGEGGGTVVMCAIPSKPGPA